MHSNSWVNQKIAILGYGVEGQSSVNYFLRHGAKHIHVHDQKSSALQASKFAQQHQQQGVVFMAEDQAFKDLPNYDLIMRTPTFHPQDPVLKNIPLHKISSQTKLFLQQWRDQTIGISGTKGKGTVATIIHHLLIKSGKKAFLGGNIGVPLLDIIDNMDKQSIAVVELSSFQLWDIEVSPQIAVLTMVVPEHLEQHATTEDYFAAKQNLLRYQNQSDKAIVLIDFAYTKQIAHNMPGKQWHITKYAPTQGLQIKGNKIYEYTNPDKILANLSDTELIGSHNAYNLAAAIQAVILLGIDEEQVSGWLRDYKPLPHRLQLIKKYKSISFYDDSIATTPEAAIAGIKSFDQSKVVILGGINKNASWHEVAKALADSNTKGVVLVGEESLRIKHAIEAQNFKASLLLNPQSLDQAVSWSASKLENEEEAVVLLSPGAKSFDQYQDYRDRGEKFTQAVLNFVSKNQN